MATARAVCRSKVLPRFSSFWKNAPLSQSSRTDVSRTDQIVPEACYCIYKKNTDGSLRMEFRKGWIERAEVLFLKPKPAAKN